ncbi:MAG: histidine decarboxylase [Verrucomicrobiales bacterium]
MPPQDEPPRLSRTDQQRLDDLYRQLGDLRPRSIGYPCNQEFDYAALARFLEFAVNNVGDPFGTSNYRMNTHEFEREVVHEFARLTQAQPANYWGYVTAGGTEGNMYGLYIARELFPQSICYFSEDSHYSVTKILRLQHTRNIMIKSQPNGEMDYADLRETLRLHRDVPPIIFANIGTTMKGALDNLATIHEILNDLAISERYLHADAALSGMILPFVNEPQPWNFAAGIDSISISGHKLLGSPLPCGVVLARQHHVDRIARSIEYVGALDTTIAGSRNALAPLFLWYRLRTLGVPGMARLVERCLAVADYAVRKLHGAGIEAWRHKNSITVVFPRPPEAVMKKWIIAPRASIGHIITLPPANEAAIDEFVSDFSAALGSSRPSTQPVAR